MVIRSLERVTMELKDALETVEDPRACNAKHDLADILFVVVVTVLVGGRTAVDMHELCLRRLDLLRKFVPLEDGAPSHDTFSRVLRLVDPKGFDAAFGRFIEAFTARMGLDRPTGVVAVDGKSMRRAYDHGKAHMPPLVVSILAHDTFITLAQRIRDSGGEKAAAIEALNLLSLKGCTVTADALHATPETTAAIRRAGGHYCITLKGNQPLVAAEAHAKLDARIAARARGARGLRTEERKHGRVETRTAYVVPFRPTPKSDGKNLVGVKAVGRIVSERVDGTGRSKTRTRDFILSERLTPGELIDVTRKHWQIENNLHWPLDVHFREDDQRARKDNAPANLAVAARLALNILRAQPGKEWLSRKRFRASIDPDYVLELFTHMR
jgi:predicted transposase YbfD/YdcC